MKMIFLALIVFISNAGLADAQRPKYCSDADLAVMGEVWRELEASGFEQTRIDKGIGVQGGDCMDAYSLAKLAGVPSPADAPPPACGLIFFFDQAQQVEQAKWVLNTLGLRITTKSGGTLRVCGAVKRTGPTNPGVTVHD